MIRSAQRRGRSPFSVPSRDRIRQIAAEIQKSWSPGTRDRRSAEGIRRVESIVAALLFENGELRRNGD
jgi:hypothetical protein